MPTTSRVISGFVALALTSTLLTAVGTVDPHPATAVTPTVDLAGDPTFDSNSIADSSSLQPRWNSLPGSRWGMGMDQGRAIDSVLSLDMGGYVADKYRMPYILSTGVSAPGQPTTGGTATSTWYPYQMTFTGQWASLNTTILGGDLFASTDSVVRYLRLDSAGPVDLTIAGAIPDGMTAAWSTTDQALYVNSVSFGYVLTFFRGVGATPLEATPVRASEAATVDLTNRSWKFVRTTGDGDTYVSIGFWVAPHTPATGLARSVAALSQPVATTAYAAKNAMDALLRSVPAPANFGVSGVNSMGSTGRAVTPALHRSMYYRAWAFQVQQVISPQADWTAGTWGHSTFPYSQVSCGKPVLKEPEPGFNAHYSILETTCPWESFLSMQMLAFVPDLRDDAFNALHGLLEKVVQGGDFYGERLPSRAAQTAWILYQQTQDAGVLAGVYPHLKRFLLYMQEHPYHVVSEEANLPADDQDPERDIEYVASWLFDVQFAERIANALGLTADAADWRARATTELGHLRTWFFSDPSGKIHTFYFSPGVNYAGDRTIEVPISILSTLAVPNLPTDLRDRLIQYWVNGYEPPLPGLLPAYRGFDPTVSGEGQGWTKYGTTSLIALGAIGHIPGPTPYQYVNSGVRDAVYASKFAEYLKPGNGLSDIHGVATSTFSASQIIDFTLLQNGFALGVGGPNAVLSVPVSASFASGFETTDPPLPSAFGSVAPSGGVSGVSSPALTLLAGYQRSGQRSVMYSGLTPGSGHVYSSLEIVDLTATPIPVTTGTTLQYSIFPWTMDGAPTGTSSTFVSVDLVFSDGSVLRNLGATDQHGNALSPQGQGGHLRLNDWNRVMSAIGGVAAGKSITHIVLSYDQPTSPGNGYRGFIDDISVANGYLS